MAFYPTRDERWSYLHCNFPNHRAATLSVLDVPEDREAVGRTATSWNAADLEEANIAAKAIHRRPKRRNVFTSGSAPSPGYDVLLKGV
jgi:hypothetical protein